MKSLLTAAATAALMGLCLPLSAAHLPARIQVQNAHQLMFLAFAYFRKT